VARIYILHNLSQSFEASNRLLIFQFVKLVRDGLPTQKGRDHQHAQMEVLHRRNGNGAAHLANAELATQTDSATPLSTSKFKVTFAKGEFLHGELWFFSCQSIRLIFRPGEPHMDWTCTKVDDG
jgi:hypothetical protein